MDELVSTWRSWAPEKLYGIESALGNALGIPVGEERRSTICEYKHATKGMTEEEELEYVKNKYGGEIQWDVSDEGGKENKK